MGGRGQRGNPAKQIPQIRQSLAPCRAERPTNVISRVAVSQKGSDVEQRVAVEIIL